jgi:hypothetical protein
MAPKRPHDLNQWEKLMVDIATGVLARIRSEHAASDGDETCEVPAAGAPQPTRSKSRIGVANRIGPEPCVGIREDDGEASVGERIGQPLSRESKIIPGADHTTEAQPRARNAISVLAE